MTSISMLSLLTLLPLLALASPLDRSFPHATEKRNTGNSAAPLSFQQVSDSIGISAQMMFLGTKNKVYVLDKSENNPVTINGKYGTHPAWAVEYDLASNEYRTMDVYSNTFCAGGGVLGNGTWVVFGGNQPVTTDGVAVANQGQYHNTDGGTAIRMINPCDDESCEWIQGETSYDITAQNTGGYLQMTGRRWYPIVEALEDGSLIIIGGDKNGGYVNTAAQDNPTYEFFPPKGDGEAIYLQFLADTLPVNLYALTWLMPSGKLFMQANRASILYDYKKQTTTNLPDMPYATRVYPASAATAMLPLTPDNNYEPTILFCGGSNPPQWGNDGTAGYNVTAVPADNTCVRIAPDAANPAYEDDDYMFEGRSMGQFVALPDGTYWMANGVTMGTAGYGNDRYSVGQSYGQNPVYMPAIYNPTAPKGGRWNRTGLSASSNERMYHSTAILLPDSSILISGSNPNADFTNDQWRSRTDVEKWFPWYYNEPRPTFSSPPTNLSYGGASFDIPLNTTDETTVASAKVVVIRGGFNTHAIAFNQRYLQLNSTYTIDMNTNMATLHVSQMPGTTGPYIFQPGPAMIFLVINGVPSEGEFVMVGSGQLGTQPTQANADLPPTQVIAVTPTESAGSSSNSSTAVSKTGAGVMSASSPVAASLGVAFAFIAGLLVL